jgi:hypothetical protein
MRILATTLFVLITLSANAHAADDWVRNAKIVACTSQSESEYESSLPITIDGENAELHFTAKLDQRLELESPIALELPEDPQAKNIRSVAKNFCVLSTCTGAWQTKLTSNNRTIKLAGEVSLDASTQLGPTQVSQIKLEVAYETNSKTPAGFFPKTLVASCP